MIGNELIQGWEGDFKKNRSNVRLLYTSSAQKKSETCKRKSVSSDLVILYPAPKIWNPNLNFKLRWCKILPLAPRNYFLLAPIRIFLGIGDSRIFLSGITLCFSPLGFTMLLLSWGTNYMNDEMVKWLNKYFLVGVLLCFYFLGELHQWTTRQDLLRSPWPSRRLRIYSRLKY